MGASTKEQVAWRLGLEFASMIATISSNILSIMESVPRPRLDAKQVFGGFDGVVCSSTMFVPQPWRTTSSN